MVWRQIWMNEGIPLPSHISRHFCKYGDKSSQVHFLRPGKRCVLVGVEVLMCGPPGFAGGLQAEQIVWKQLIAILTLELLHYEGMRPKHVCMVLLEFVTFEMKNLWDSWNTFLCRWEKPTHTEKKNNKKRIRVERGVCGGSNTTYEHSNQHKTGIFLVRVVFLCFRDLYLKIDIYF